MEIKANCKINIGLDVLRRRADGYHDLSTVMVPVKGLYDVLTVEQAEEELKELGVTIVVARQEEALKYEKGYIFKQLTAKVCRKSCILGPFPL